MQLTKFVTERVKLSEKAIQAILSLLNEGATIPFIARYRKAQTQGADELQIQAVQDAVKQYQQIEQRKETILKALQEQEVKDHQLFLRIEESFDLNELEDLYLPYKKSRKTKAEKARLAGLEGLAKILMTQGNEDPYKRASKFLSNEVVTIEKAIEGAQHIIAEWLNEHTVVRAKLRKLYLHEAVLIAKITKGKEQEAYKYKDFFDYSQRLKSIPSHRFLAIQRGQNESFLKLKLEVPKSSVLPTIERFFVKNDNTSSQLVSQACWDGYKRLLHPALENELMNSKKEQADKEAITVFTKNLRQLLLEAPLGRKRILAIDPGYKSGCKVVCLDDSGDLLTNVTIFPHAPQKDTAKSKSKIAQLVQAYNVEVIAVGNGTASRETERMLRTIKFDRDIEVFMVSEDGASVYSASSVARKEFPSYDVTVRGAVSIGRRLMDPLAELVKIDPKSLGIGQYQHDVQQTALKDSLDQVVSSCVNNVGVNVNTASTYLLQYVSGLGPQLAEKIIQYRTENGPITSRDELKNIPRLGEKAFQLSAGFLRIPESNNLLDHTAVHPESYQLVEEILRFNHKSLAEIVENPKLVKDFKNPDSEKIDDYTFKDILQELQKPGRDPRAKKEQFSFDQSIHTIQDLFVGKELPGIITNITGFGAFVDIGLKENGLIHNSNMSDDFVSDPSEIVTLHQQVTVKVISINEEQKRIGLKLIE